MDTQLRQFPPCSDAELKDAFVKDARAQLERSKKLQEDFDIAWEAKHKKPLLPRLLKRFLNTIKARYLKVSL